MSNLRHMGIFLSGIAFFQDKLKLLLGEIAPGFGLASESGSLTPSENPDEQLQEGFELYREMSEKPMFRAGLRHRDISYLWKSASGIPSKKQREGEVELDPFDRDAWQQPPQLLPASSDPQDLDIWKFVAWNLDHRFFRATGFFRVLHNLQYNAIRFGYAVEELDWQIQETGEYADSLVLNNVWDRSPDRFVKDPEERQKGWYLKNSSDDPDDLSGPLPERKFLFYAPFGYLENPYGTSEFKGLVKNDYNKKHFKLWLGRHLETWGSGRVSAGYDFQKYGGKGEAANRYRAELLASLKSGRNQGVFIYPKSKDGLPDIVIQESQGAGSLFVESLDYEDKQISVGMVGNSMAIVQPSVGSHALSQSTVEIDKSEYEHLDLQAEQPLLNVLVKYLVDYNWIDIEKYPYFQIVEPDKGAQPTLPDAKEDSTEQKRKDVSETEFALNSFQKEEPEQEGKKTGLKAGAGFRMR